MTLGDTLYALPGDTVQVEVEADGNGDVATAREGVYAVSENNRNLVVEETAGQNGNGIGVLANDPKDLRPSDKSESDFSSGDSVGLATMILTKPVLLVNTDSGYTASVGDTVAFGDGGDIEAVNGPTATSVSTVTNALGHDGSGNLETEAASASEVDITDGFPWGVVVATVATEFGVGSGTVAVATIR